MNVPDFFVIGAQKCGTTTVHEDLQLHPDIYLGEKESTELRGPERTSQDIVSSYTQIFRRAHQWNCCGEVSTRYSMLPDAPEMPHNASLANPHAKAIYIVRDPIDRVISHHHHDFGLELVGSDINQAVHTYPPLLDNTRYATQIRPWIAALGAANVRAVRFEDYMSGRQEGLAALFEFLGLRPVDVDPGDVAHNAASTKYIAPGRWGKISQNPIYRRGIRPLVDERIRRRLNRAVLPKAPPRPDPPTPDTISTIIDELQDEVVQLAKLIGEPVWWDLDISRSKHIDLSS